jgi:hypothetical protein
MVNMDSIVEELRQFSLYAEICESDPAMINGGTTVETFNGIKIFSRAFSVCLTGDALIVKLPQGQFVDEYIVSKQHEVARFIIEHYREEGFI